jgi:hypothetical protein
MADGMQNVAALLGTPAAMQSKGGPEVRMVPVRG